MGMTVKRSVFFGVTALVLGLLFAILPASAAINEQINFQGKITNPNGTNVTNGSYNFTFSIYTVSSGGTAAWTETKSLTVTDGIFQTALGDTTAFGGTVDFNNSSLHLGITVGADPEMTPRVRLTSAPYAFNSGQLNGLGSSSFVQLAQGLQVDASTTNASIAINKTGGTAGIMQLQRAGSDILAIANSGAYTYTLSAANNPSYTIVNNGSGNIITNLAASGDFLLQDNGATFFTVSDTGAFDISLDATDNPTFTLTNNGSGAITYNLAGTGDFILQDNGVAFITVSDTGSYDFILDSSDNPTYAITNNGTGNITTNLVGTGDIVFSDNGSTFLTLSDAGGFSLSLDATDNPTYTVTNSGSSDVATNLAGTGDFTVQDNGVTFLTLSDSGAYTFTLDATDNPAYSITNNGSGNIVQNLAGTGDFILQDNGSAFFTASDTGAIAIDLDATDNPAFTLTNNGTSNVTFNLASTGDFIVQDNGTALVSINDDGTFLANLTGTSTAAFELQDAGTEIFSVDTTNSRIYIGNATADGTGTLLVLDSKNTAGDPTGVNGSFYYNSNSNKFRCYENGTWGDCFATRIVGETTLGAANATISITLSSSTEYLQCRLDIKSRSLASVPWVRFNNASGAGNYGWNTYGITAAAVTDWQGATDTEIQLSGTQTGTNPFSADVKITNFADTNKVVDWSAAGGEPVATNSNRYSGVGVYYNNTTAISSVQFIASTGTFAAGSHAWCEGRDVP